MERLDVISLLRVERGVDQQFRHANHAVERRSDLVAHFGQELALGQIGLVGLVDLRLQHGIGLVELFLVAPDPQQRFDAGLQFRRIHRHCDEIIGAEIDGLASADVIGPCRHHTDRDRTVGIVAAEFLQETVTVHDGHNNIQQNEIGTMLFEHFQSLAPIPRLEEGYLLVTQHALDCIAVRDFIFDEQNDLFHDDS